MHSSRMRTACSLTISPYLIVSHVCPPGSNHACPPGRTTHAPQEQPHMPLPPKATTHAPPPPGSSHAPPQSNHACPPGATMHVPPQEPHTPRSNHTCPPPRKNHTPPMNRMTNWCKNITIPQTSFAGGNNNFSDILTFH